MTPGGPLISLMIVATAYSGARTLTSKTEADFGQSALDAVAGMLTLFFSTVMIYAAFFMEVESCSGQ